MAMAGYSGKALLKKLGIKPGMKILVMHSPENYEQLLNWPINGQFSVRGEIPDLIHLLAKDMNCFLSGMKKILPLCKKNTAVVIWVSWYKKSLGIVTDLKEDQIRNLPCKTGLWILKYAL